MSDLINAAINVFMGGQPEPIDWGAKRLADEQVVRRQRALSKAPSRPKPTHSGER